MPEDEKKEIKPFFIDKKSYKFQLKQICSISLNRDVLSRISIDLLNSVTNQCRSFKNTNQILVLSE